MLSEETEQSIFEGYEGDEQSLRSYSVLASVFTLIFGAFLLVARKMGHPIPERLEAKDMVLLGVAAHKLSLIGANDAVMSPLRAPFVKLQEKDSPKSIDEKPRGRGLRRSIGELLTCQFCLGMWVTAFLTYGLILAPRVTRLVASILTILTISDHLHQTYKFLQKRV